jgi:transposase
MDIVKVFVGLDYHSASIRVCVLTPEGDELLNRNIPNEVGSVIGAIQNLAPAIFVEGVAIEACTGSAEFATRLAAATEWPVRLAHAAAVHRLKQGPDKTDHHDAWLLADLVRIGYLPEVWLADPQTRQFRRLVRYRQGLVAERKNIKLRIRALLREERLCCRDARPWTKAWMQWLPTAALGEESAWVLQQEQARLMRIEQDIRAAEERLQQATHDDETTQRLLKQPGIGLITAVTLRAEVGRFDRFRNGKQLSRFCGVTPCNASSGRREADAGLVKSGNSALRAVIIQAAQRLPRHEPRWKELKDRLRRSKPANVATAAVANRWLRWLYHQMTAIPETAVA